MKSLAGNPVAGALTKTRLLALSLVLCSAVACRRAPTAGAAGAERKPVAALATGLGNARFPVRIKNEEARAFFKQGVDDYFAFNFEEAKRSFARAAELEPASPMPWWGEAMAVGPNYNDTQPGVDRRKEAAEALRKAAVLAGSSGDARERGYVEALAARYGSGPDYALQGEPYAAAMKALHARYPEDQEAAVLYAEALMVNHVWNLWGKNGEPRASTPEIVGTLEAVLRQEPDNVGANHLLIHAVEASGDPGRGEAAAERIARLAPAAGHLVHMPSHIYQRMGEFAASAKANEQAIAVDDGYYRALGNPPVGTRYYDTYRVHNKYFLVAGCNMAGEDACAQKAARELAAYVRPAVPSGKMNPWFMVQEPWMLVRFEHWEQVLGAARLQADAPRPLKSMWLYARVCALAATGRVEEARGAERDLESSARGLPTDFATDMGTPGDVMVKLAVMVATARVDEAAGDRAGALRTWRAAVALQDRFGYSEPPDWYYPVRESLGGALLRGGEARAAEAVFRRDLELNRGNGRALFGLWQALVAERRAAEAAKAEEAFRQAWGKADVRLTVEGL